MVGGLRSDLGSGDGQAVHIFKDASVSRGIVLRRRLGCVLSVLDGISKNGLTLSRDLELSVQWDAIVSAGPCGPFVALTLLFPLLLVFRFLVIMFVFCMMLLLDFLHKVVVYRKDVAVRGLAFLDAGR